MFLNKSCTNIITNRYGASTLSLFRNLEKYEVKIRKFTWDIQFLKTCINNNLTPKFLRFKTALHNFQNDADYRVYQRKLLNKELESKRLFLEALYEHKWLAYNELKSRCSFLDFQFCLYTIRKTVNRSVESTDLRHTRKIFNLGLQRKI